MNNLFEYLFQDFFKTSQYLETIENYNATLDASFDRYSKEYKKGFKKFGDYRKFKHSLRNRILISALLLVPLLISLFCIYEKMLIKGDIESGTFLMLSLVFLLFLFLFSSVLMAPAYLNSYTITNSFDEKTLILASLLLTYIAFLMGYFFFYENTTINHMFNLDSANQYKVKSTLEMIRSFLVFTLTAIVLTNFNAHIKSLPQKQTKINEDEGRKEDRKEQ